MSDLFPSGSHGMGSPIEFLRRTLVQLSSAELSPSCRSLSGPARPRIQVKHVPTAHRVNREPRRPRALRLDGSSGGLCWTANADPTLLQPDDLYPRTGLLEDPQFEIVPSDSDVPNPWVVSAPRPRARGDDRKHSVSVDFRLRRPPANTPVKSAKAAKRHGLDLSSR